MTIKMLALCATAALTLGAAGAAQAIAIHAAFEYATAPTGLTHSDLTLGQTFSLSSSVTLNALGYFDDGQHNDHQVGIWDSSNVLVASTTVLGGAGFVGHFRWTGLSHFTTLGPGTYTIGGEVFAEDPIPFDPTGITTIPEFTYGGGVGHTGSGFVQPTTARGDGNNAFLVANFSIVPSDTPPAPVPEPAAWTLMIAGFGLAGAALRRRERKALGA